MARGITELRQDMVEMDGALNRVADEMKVLRERIKGGISAEEAEEIGAAIDRVTDRLTVLGSNPDNPVPPEPA